MLIVIVSLRSVTIYEISSRFYVCDGGGGGVCVCMEWGDFIASTLDGSSILYSASVKSYHFWNFDILKIIKGIWTVTLHFGERGGSVVECRTPERGVGGSKPTSAMLCPWARHFTPRKYWLITQEAVAPSRHNWKIVDWNVKPQHKQTNFTFRVSGQLQTRLEQ